MKKELYERLKESRKNLSLSQEYVAKLLGVHRTVITAIELGSRKVTTEELKFFSKLYGVSLDDLLYGKDNDGEVAMFARTFSQLSDIDKKEILNLINFKHRMKEFRD